MSDFTMDELNLIIARNISTLRLSHSMTQLELAQRLNYSDKLVSKWERGEAVPNAYTLKQLADMFCVPVDYLFRDHVGEDRAQDALTIVEEQRAPAEGVLDDGTIRHNHRIITAISLLGIWLVALVVFVVLWSVVRPLGMIFVYALPVSLITYLVLNSVWNRGRRNSFIISALVASILVTVYFALLSFGHNVWQIFLLLVPAELLVLLSTQLKHSSVEQRGEK